MVPYPEFLYGDFYFKFREALKNHPAIVEPDPYFGPLKAFIPGYGVNTLAIGHNGYIRMQKERQEDEIVHLIEPDEDFDQIYFTEEGLEALGWDSEKVPKRNLLIGRARVSGVDLTTNERIKEMIENEPYLGAETFSKNNPCTPTPADSLQDPTQPLPWRVHKTHN